MQVTLTQIEIETAIQDYIDSLIEIKEGSEVVVTELRAGRGPEGFTATVDIRPEGYEAPEEATKTETAPVAATASTEAPKRRGRPPRAAVVDQEISPAQVESRDGEIIEEPEAEAVVEEPEVEAAAATSVAEEAVDTAEVAPVTEAPKKSLFSGLAKPTNT